MDKEIQKIIEDLYDMDPSLKKYEKEMEQLIKRLIEAKPDIKLNAEFVENLKRQLIQRTKDVSEADIPKFSGQFAVLRKLVYGLSGALAMALVIMVLISSNLIPIKSHKVFENYVTQKGDNAFVDFGNIQTSQDGQALYNNSGVGGGAPASEANYMAKTEEATVSAPMGDVAVRSMAVSGDTVSSPGVSEGSSGSGAIAPMPPYYGDPTYKYVYKGTLPEITEDKMNVYKYSTYTTDDSSLMNVLASFDFNLLNLKSFEGLKLDYINLSEKADDGYAITIDFNGGTISMNKRMEYWVLATEKCAGDAKCISNAGDVKPLTLADVPSDEEIIKISDSFFEKHGIKTDIYGKPVVNNEWKKYSQDFIPDTLSIIYPLMMDGKNAVDENGNPVGIGVNVNIREKEVASVWELRAQRYDSSLYEVEKSNEAILKLAENGGWNSFQYGDPNNIAEVELGEPTLSYMKIYDYSGNSFRADEYFVPAYIFPIVKRPDSMVDTWKQNVVVPIVKGLENNPPQAVPYGMMR